MPFNLVCLGLEIPKKKNSGEKELRKTFVRGLVGAGHRTRVCAKLQGLYPQKRRGHLGVCRAENICNWRSYVVITWFQYGIYFGR